MKHAEYNGVKKKFLTIKTVSLQNLCIQWMSTHKWTNQFLMIDERAYENLTIKAIQKMHNKNVYKNKNMANKSSTKMHKRHN